MLFKVVDDIIRLGKLAYLEIPTGKRCKGCLLLSESNNLLHKGWYCRLRPAYALMHDKDGPFKADSCPRSVG